MGVQNETETYVRGGRLQWDPCADLPNQNFEKHEEKHKDLGKNTKIFRIFLNSLYRLVYSLYIIIL